MVKTKTIKGLTDTYEIEMPTGRLGAIQMSLFTKMIPKSKERDAEGNLILSPADDAKIADGFVEWSEKVLKHMKIKSGQKYDDIPGEDQMIIFMQMYSPEDVSFPEA